MGHLRKIWWIDEALLVRYLMVVVVVVVVGGTSLEDHMVMLSRSGEDQDMLMGLVEVSGMRRKK